MQPPFVINVVMNIDDTHFLAVKTEVDGDAAPTTTSAPILAADRWLTVSLQVIHRLLTKASGEADDSRKYHQLISTPNYIQSIYLL